MRVIVTGAASGIGRATCLRLARDGKATGKPARIAAVDLGGSTALDAVVAELAALGAEAVALSGDMGTAEAPGRVVADAVARFGGLDGLVSNAGINRPGPLVSYPLADWDRCSPSTCGRPGSSPRPRIPRSRPRRRHRGGGVHVGQQRARQPGRLWAEQGRRHHAVPGARAGVRPRRHPRQYRLAGHGPHRHDLAQVYAGPRGRRRGAMRWCRSDAWPRRKTWPTSSPFSWAPTPATSTATTSWWTAASPAITWGRIPGLGKITRS